LWQTSRVVSIQRILELSIWLTLFTTLHWQEVHQWNKNRSALVKCKEIVDRLKKLDVYKEMLGWFYDQTITRSKKPCSNQKLLKDVLGLNPWVIENELSIENLRKSIIYLDEDLKNSVEFLIDNVMWENPEYLSTSSGPGLILAMFASVYPTFPTFPEILSFPPAGEIELDCRGNITIEQETACIEIGEIKSSKNKVPDAKKQLKRSLLFFVWLHKLIYGEQYKYELKGYIFWIEGSKGSKPKIITEMDTENIISFTKCIFCKSEEGSGLNEAKE
jgi:hypothetical protein